MVGSRWSVRAKWPPGHALTEYKLCWDPLILSKGPIVFNYYLCIYLSKVSQRAKLKTQVKLSPVATEKLAVRTMAAHGARILWLVKLSQGIKKCETVYFYLLYFSKIWSVWKRTQAQYSNFREPHIFSNCRIFCMAGTSWAKKMNLNLPPPERGGIAHCFFFGRQEPASRCHWYINDNFFVSKGKCMLLSPTHCPNWGVWCVIWVSKCLYCDRWMVFDRCHFFRPLCQGYRHQVRSNYGQEGFPSWDFLWIHRLLSPICLRSAGVMKPRGFRRQVRK